MDSSALSRVARWRAVGVVENWGTAAWNRVAARDLMSPLPLQEGDGHALLSAGSADNLPNRTRMGRVMGSLFFLGGSLGLVSPLLPQPQNFDVLGVVVPSVMAVSTGLMLFFAAPYVPPLITVILGFLATLLVTAHSYFAGALATTVVMLYVWVSAFTFFFHARWIAWAQVGFVGLSLAVLLLIGHISAGTMRWLYAMTTVVVTGGMVSYLVQQVHRLAAAEGRARREAERAKADLEVASQHKTEFLANMSHELRTPLNAIIGFSDVLKARMFGELNERQEEYIGDILTSGQHLLDLINDILDIAKVEAGRMELEIDRFSLRETIESAVAMLRERASRKRVTLAIEAAPDVDEIDADQRKVKQVLFNLLTNAVKFTPEGGRVTVAAQRGAGEVMVSVADSGIGIPPEEQALIFEEFRQASAGTARQQEGTGLGLALSKRFVELHGGRIGVESAVGAGSTFTFSLPMRDAMPPQEPPPAAVPADPPGAAGPVILLVEDDPRTAKLLAIYFEEAGYQIAVARHTEEGLAKARALRPVGIVLDIVLPAADGWDFLSRLKADPALHATPVMIVSIVDERGRGFALGAAEYLVKPIDQQTLLAALRRVMRQRATGNGRGTVLAIDDDPLAIDIVEAMVSPEGFTVLRATNGPEGIAAARRMTPDLVILDLLMPGMDGFAVAEALRADPLTAAIPILVLTSATLTAADKERLNAHVSALAQKGEIDRAAFLDLVRRSCAAEA